MGSSNMYTPTLIGQVRYVSQWFKEWSEMQRNDFLPILVQAVGNKGYVNGLLPDMNNLTNLEDKPPSLFQCRIKLFKEWSEGWTQIEKDQLIADLKSLDEDFTKKYEEEINGKSEISKSENVMLLNGFTEVEGVN